MKDKPLNNIDIVATDDFKHCVDGVQDIPLDTRTIQIVAHHLTNWEQLAPYLQLTATDMEEIKRDYPTYTEQKYQCIMIWASKNGEAATVINPLWHIYFDLNDKSLVIKIMKELKRKGTYVVCNSDPMFILLRTMCIVCRC